MLLTRQPVQYIGLLSSFVTTKRPWQTGLVALLERCHAYFCSYPVLTSQGLAV